MRAILNRHMFTTRVFDSGALGVLASVVHQFGEPGLYEAVIRHKDAVIGSVWFQVADSSNMQLDIDLASAIRPASAHKDGKGDGCGCGDAKAAPATRALPIVSPNGYVLFYVSHGEGGYSVTVGREGGEKPLFDSTTLGQGDLFAVTLLAPTRYTMTNRTGGAKGTIVVRQSSETARSLAAMGAPHVETKRDAFSPDRLEVVSGQGIVFRILEPSRVVIEQGEEPKTAGRPSRKRRFYARPHVEAKRPQK